MKTFKVGDKVKRITVGDKGTFFIEEGGKVGGIYTISAIDNWADMQSTIQLEEFPNGNYWHMRFFELVMEVQEEYI